MLVTNTCQWLTHPPPLLSLQITHEITSVQVSMAPEGRVLILICQTVGGISSATQQMCHILQILRPALYFGGWNKHHHTGKSWVWDSGKITWMVPLKQQDLYQNWTCFLQFYIITIPLYKHLPWTLCTHDVVWPTEKISKRGCQSWDMNGTVCWGSHSEVSKTNTIYFKISRGGKYHLSVLEEQAKWEGQDNSLILQNHTG